MRWFYLFVVVLLLSGCSLPIPGLTAVAPITNIGDKAEVINTVNNQPSTFWQLMMILGWMAPSPQEIFKGFGNFILKLFGRYKGGDN